MRSQPANDIGHRRDAIDGHRRVQHSRCIIVRATRVDEATNGRLRSDEDAVSGPLQMQLLEQKTPSKQLAAPLCVTLILLGGTSCRQTTSGPSHLSEAPDTVSATNAATAGPYMPGPVTFVSHGDSLAGTTVFPKDEIRAAVVFIHGSGPQTRDLSLAERFAASGIAALVYDKRGVGESGGTYEGKQSVSEKNIRPLADDARAAFRLRSCTVISLKSQTRTHTSHLDGWMAAARSVV